MNLSRLYMAYLLVAISFFAAQADARMPSGRGWFHASEADTNFTRTIFRELDVNAIPNDSSELAAPFQEMMLLTAQDPSPRIAELAAALDHDPVNLYQFVKNNIRYVPYWGFMRGAERTLIDGAGNDADQSLLLMELLSASGYEPRLAYAGPDGWSDWGVEIPLRGDPDGYDAESWLGITNGLTPVVNLLSKAEISYRVEPGSTPETTRIATERLWVSVEIGNETAYFDPAFKPRTRRAAADVLAAAGYSRTNLLAVAGGTGDVTYIQDVDSSALRGELARLTGNLAANWREADPTMNAVEVAGGDAIRQTHDEGGVMGDCGYIYDFLTQDQEFQELFQSWVALEIGGLFHWEWMDEVAAKTIRVTFTNDPPCLFPKARLEIDGVLVAEEPQGSDVSTETAYIGVNHFITGPLWENYVLKRAVSNVYVIPMSFGADGGFGMRDQANRRLAAYASDGATSRLETTTRMLEALGQDWLARADADESVTARLRDNISVILFRLGVAGQDRVPFVDMKSAYVYSVTGGTRLYASDLVDSAFEHAVIEQARGTNHAAVSTMRVLDLANREGQRLFLLDSNTVGSVRGQMVNYPTYMLDDFEANTADGWSYFLPQNGAIALNSWTGLAWLAFAQTTGGFSTYSMLGTYNGGLGTEPGELDPNSLSEQVGPRAPEVEHPKSPEPVDLCSGAYLSDRIDFVSAGPVPLVLSRHYNSEQRGREGPFGWGWTHDYDVRLSFHADPNAAFGGRTPADCAATLLGCAVIEDLLASGSDPRRLGVASLIASWTAETQSDGAASVKVGSRTWTFTRQPDGSFSPPPGVTASLVRTNGLYVMRERLGEEWWFDASNRLTSVLYPDGNGLGLTYDAQDRLSVVTNSFGRSLAVSYNANGLIEEVEDDAGRRVAYSYDSDGDLATVTDACGSDWTISTDEGHRIVSLTDPEGIVTIQNAYNGLDRVTNQISATGGGWRFGFAGPGASGRQCDPEEYVTRYEFDARGRTVLRIDKDGGENRAVYDGQNHVTETVNAAGITNRVEYDGRNNVRLIVEAAGTPDARTNAFGYDSQDRLVAVTDAVGRVYRMAYDSAHRLTSVTAPDGLTVTNAFNASGLLETVRAMRGGTVWRETQVSYNAQGLPITVASTDAGTVSNTFDSAGNLTAVTDGRGNQTRFQFDALGRLTNTIDAANHSWPRAWWRNGLARSAADPFGRVVEWNWAPSYKLATLTLPGGGVWSNGYDWADRLAWSVDARGAETDLVLDSMGRTMLRYNPLSEERFYYDALGNVTSSVDGAWARTGVQYDRLNRPVSVTDPLGHISTVTRNALGWPVETVDPRGRVTGMGYDPMGRLTWLRKPSGRIETLGYDALGRPAAYTNAAGQAFRLAWDAQGRLLAATNALGEEVQRLAYDEAGNMVERVDGAGRSAVFAYDPLNRATNALYADGTNLSFAFDAAGALIRATGPGATNTFGYGADGALAASTSTAGGVTFEVRYLRDLAGNVTNLIYPDGRRVAYDYDAENRLAEMRDWNERAYRFGRDGAGRVTEVAFPNGVTNEWTRDQAGRVTGWRYEKSGTTLLERNFTLDAVGRILDAEYAVGPQPVFPATRRLDFANNAADRITASGVYSGTNVENSVWLYDGAGTVTNGGGRSYAYGARGLLERAWGTNVDFEVGYDALGNRVWERSGGAERRFAVDHADPFKRPLVETDASGAVVRRFVWGPDRLLVIEEADGTLRVALTDERGSVVGLANAAGALTDTFVYGPYGEDWGRTGTNTLAFRWLGGYGVRHAGGSLYLTRFRSYDTDTRRFLSADPLGLAGGGNLYAYGAGDPMFFIDPLGLEAEIRQGDNDLDRYVSMVERNLILLGYEVIISPFMDIADAQTEFLKNPTVDGACAVIRPFTATLLLIMLGMPAESVPAKGSVTLVENVVEKTSSGLANETVMLTSEQAANLERFSKKLPAGNTGIAVDMLGDGTLFTSEVPGRVPGSKAVYQKSVDAAGNTTGYLKTTVDPQGNIIHIKDKLNGGIIPNP